MQLVPVASYFNHIFMSDETIINPVPEETPEVNETPVVRDSDESSDSGRVNEVVETPTEATVETSTEDSTSAEASESPVETSEAPSEDVAPAEEAVSATPVRTAPLTALSARPERPSRGGGQGGGRRDDRGGGGGDRGGRRDDRRGGKSGFEQVKKEFEEVLLEVGRVTKVTSGGRQLRFRAAVVIGDRKGRVGFGLGKAQEVSIAVEKAVNSAKRHMITVPLKEGTVPYQVATKFKSVKIMIHPAAQGTGIIAGGSARRILELAGCQDILSKRHGGRNVITTAYATMAALKMYQIKHERPSFSKKEKVLAEETK